MGNEGKEVKVLPETRDLSGLILCRVLTPNLWPGQKGINPSYGPFACIKVPSEVDPSFGNTFVRM